MNEVNTLPIEMWAGLECTYNRVGDRYKDQCLLNGHDARMASDIEKFISLGVSRIRYPVLWEKSDDWSASDLALETLRKGGVKPVVGLLHHGSGPRDTSLIDPDFPEKLAAFALKVAERYPWVDAYTPVNEPLTTARFSGLYGFWYPHKSDDASFVRALLNQLKGVILSMRAIRTVNPAALLVQTEDLGCAKGTPRLQYQVDFENLRRWLSFDLLCGHVDESHGMYRYLIDRGGASPEELAWFRDNACPPSIIGINHYPLSNRFLDHRLELYPPHLHGGNGRHRYADVGAVDCADVTSPTPAEILRDVWDRYRLPIAVTEAHVSGARERQLRWLRDIRAAAEAVRGEGADVRAVTAWSLLGSYGWTSLCTCEPGHEVYESGVFDNRMSEPRETAIAQMVRAYASQKRFEHPVLSRPLLITGANGTLGRAFARICEQRGINYIALDRTRLDIGDGSKIRAAVRDLHPWAVVNAAGFTQIERAEREPALCHRENAIGARLVAEACADHGIPLLTFSSDLVFGGDQREPYSEDSPMQPLNTYGRTKAEADQAVARAHEGALIIRTSSFFSPWDHTNFLTSTIRDLRLGRAVRAVGDIWASPTYVPDLVNTSLDLLIDGERGLLHLTNEGAVTWEDWARLAARHVNADHSLVISCRGDELGLSARRPVYSALKSTRHRGLMPDVERAIETHIHTSMREGSL